MHHHNDHHGHEDERERWFDFEALRSSEGASVAAMKAFAAACFALLIVAIVALATGDAIRGVGAGSWLSLALLAGGISLAFRSKALEARIEELEFAIDELSEPQEEWGGYACGGTGGCGGGCAEPSRCTPSGCDAEDCCRR